jgi:dipeptidyl aminopeptidase/acylaminoacyl peptidase
MTAKKIQYYIVTIFFILLLLVPRSSPAQETEKRIKEQSIASWLLLGPFLSPLPAFHEDKKDDFTAEDLLKFEEFDILKLKPKLGSSIQWHDGKVARWESVQGNEKGVSLAGNPTALSTAYLGVYIDVSRWTKAKVTVTSPQLSKIYFDREVVARAKSTKSEKGLVSNEEKKISADLILETGKHLLLVKSVFDPQLNSDWTVEASLSYDEKFDSPAPSLTLSTEQKMTIQHLLDTPRVVAVSISPDGTLAALVKSQSLPPSDESEGWVEIFQVADGRLTQTYRGGMSISAVNWAPNGKKFSYTSHSKQGGTIWVVDLESGTSIPILKNIKDLGSHVWSPDGSFIIYSVIEKKEPRETMVDRFLNLADRQPGWRNQSYLYKITLSDGIRQRLTSGELSTFLNGISPDGKKLLFSRSIIDYSERPYSKTELYSLDLATLEPKLLWKGKWFGSAGWSPKGEKILILGGPSAFGDAGVNVPKGTMPNEYDTQAYLFEPLTNKVEPLTKAFNPSVEQAFWPLFEDCIYFVTTDRDYRRLYRYDLSKKEFSLIECPVDIIEGISIAEKEPVAVYTGSSAAAPPKTFILNIAKNESRLLLDPEKEDYEDVKLGEVKPWSFKNRRGREIDGRVYYPPDFDSSKKYPCIVYYYGGTTPVTREFGGRYPKNLYAAQGYVVYVLQPSGATGYGQEFSALHVNDWGLIVADEIIDGVKIFLAAHPFVDERRVGCIGASYGGFMTMLLLTRTNIFSAAIAHAGISSISSYWGEGYWGYSYSAYAAANSFPWSRKDIFVNQSPLFNADKITTPLLLLHGSADTNVPPGESTQLFTALKILGREVEYIQILDQNHQILTYNKRIIWTKTILAWFDRWLKGQAEWWIALYPSQ